MRKYSLAAATAAISLGFVFLLVGGANAQQANAPAPKVSDAKPGDVRVMVTAAIRIPIDAVRAEAEKVIGHPLVIEYGSARGGLKDEILAGQAFEVAILLPDVNEDIKAKIVPGVFDIASVDVAIGLRGEAPGLDVSTPEALKKAMLAAKSIKYAPTGAALLTVKKVISTLELAGKIKDNSAARGTAELGAGEYELNFYPLSEILPNKALKNLGPVTAKLQVPAVITAVVGKSAADVKSAQALIKFLQGPAIDAALKGNGMNKPRATSAMK